MKIAQTCQGNTLANPDQEDPNVKKQQKICYADSKTSFSQNEGSGAWTIIVRRINGNFHLDKMR